MGNYVLQKALKYTWERQNKPLLLSLINQCLMVAADVDNDLFGTGEDVSSDGEGEGIANLSYRIAALYTGRDSVLGLSSGVKYFGKRRLGRAGLDTDTPVPDNVCDFDCSTLFNPGEGNYHTAYFWTDKTIALMRTLLRGHDRAIAAGEAGIATG
jgi:esterase/lipase superfamily enzyme